MLDAAAAAAPLNDLPPLTSRPPPKKTALLAAPASQASVAFENLKNGAAVASPVRVEMAVSGLEVKPASEGLVPNTGHFHVIVDRAAADSLDEGDAIPFDATHLHYGRGQVSADIELPKGTHTLTLQFANALHESYGPQQRAEVTVRVQ
jgi:hypothetical protein